MKHTVTMLENAQGSDDGITITQFIKGETYEIGATLFKNFVEGGLVTLHNGESSAPAGDKPAPEGEAVTHWGKKKVDEIVAFLESRGVEIDPKLKKAELVSLAIEVEANGIQAVDLESLTDDDLLKIVADENIEGDFASREELLVALKAHFEVQKAA